MTWLERNDSVPGVVYLLEADGYHGLVPGVYKRRCKIGLTRSVENRLTTLHSSQPCCNYKYDKGLNESKPNWNMVYCILKNKEVIVMLEKFENVVTSRDELTEAVTEEELTDEREDDDVIGNKNKVQPTLRVTDVDRSGFCYRV